MDDNAALLTKLQEGEAKVAQGLQTVQGGVHSGTARALSKATLYTRFSSVPASTDRRVHPLIDACRAARPGLTLMPTRSLQNIRVQQHASRPEPRSLSRARGAWVCRVRTAIPCGVTTASRF